MDRATFFGHRHVQPIFRTTRELTVKTYHWVACSAPDGEWIAVIPAGSLLTINGFSSYPDGYAMSLRNSRKILKGVPGAASRFFNCPYDAMEFVEYRESR